MNKQPVTERRDIATDGNTDASHSRTWLYFDTLSQEVISNIATQLSFDERNRWHPVELIQYEGVFGDELRRTFTELNAEVSKFESIRKFLYDRTIQDDDNSGTVTSFVGRDVILAWRRCFMIGSRMLLDSFQYLRSLRLDFTHMSQNCVLPFDGLLSACGGNIEKLEVVGCRRPISQSVHLAIQQHCHSLQTLTLEMRDILAPHLLLLFRAIGSKLRRLKLVCNRKQHWAAIAECCPLLEDVQLLVGHMTFVSQLPSLRVVRFKSCPTVDYLSMILEKCPNVVIRLGTLYETETDVEEKLVVCGDRLQSFRWAGCSKPSFRLRSATDSFVKLEELHLLVNIEYSDLILEAFFSSPKPQLRKLSIEGVKLPNVFDYLATKLSSLHQFSCVTRYSETFCDVDLWLFLSSNKHIRDLSIDYRRPLDNSTRCQETFARRTASLIRSMNTFSSLRRLKIDSSAMLENYKFPSEVIADACVAFRRRGFKVQVNAIHYLI